MTRSNISSVECMAFASSCHENNKRTGCTWYSDKIPSLSKPTHVHLPWRNKVMWYAEYNSWIQDLLCNTSYPSFLLIFNNNNNRLHYNTLDCYVLFTYIIWKQLFYLSWSNILYQLFSTINSFLKLMPTFRKFSILFQKKYEPFNKIFFILKIDFVSFQVIVSWYWHCV